MTNRINQMDGFMDFTDPVSDQLKYCFTKGMHDFLVSRKLILYMYMYGFEVRTISL